MASTLLALEIKAQSVALRLRLLRERQRAAQRGWAVPSAAELLRTPAAHEIPLMTCRFLDRDARTTLLDVGANTGYWGARFRRYVPCAYIAVEPDPRAFADLRLRFPESQLHNVAAGAETGRLQLHLTADSVYSTVGTYLPDAPIKTEVMETVDVDVIKLDMIEVPDNQIVVKVDVQGFEVDVLRGASRILDRASVVIIEAPMWPTTEHANDLGILAALLREHGLAPLYFGMPGLSQTRATIPVECDVIFARPERRTMV